MERFIRRENINRYRKLLRDVKDEAERRVIQNLLNEVGQGLLPRADEAIE